jgi:hypothetical protein
VKSGRSDAMSCTVALDNEVRRRAAGLRGTRSDAYSRGCRKSERRLLLPWRYGGDTEYEAKRWLLVTT